MRMMGKGQDQRSNPGQNKLEPQGDAVSEGRGFDPDQWLKRSGEGGNNFEFFYLGN